MVSPFRENRLRSLKEQLVEEKNEETFAINCIFLHRKEIRPLPWKTTTCKDQKEILLWTETYS